MVFAFICVNAQFIITLRNKGAAPITRPLFSRGCPSTRTSLRRVPCANCALRPYSLSLSYPVPAVPAPDAPRLPKHRRDWIARHCALTNGKIGRCKLVQLHVLFLPMADFRPRLNDVHILIGFIAEFYIKRIYFCLLENITVKFAFF